MKKHSYLDNYNDESVIAFDESNLIKIKKFKEAIKRAIDDQLRQFIFDRLIHHYSVRIPQKIHVLNNEGTRVQIDQNWLGNGVVCKVLNLGNNEWEKGKIRISINVDFYPDKPETPKPPESPLDDIRKLINNDLYSFVAPASSL